MMSNFQINEKHLSQIPALQLLIGLGFEFLTPAEALRERQDRTSNVLLESILRNQLKVINRIRYKGGEYLFSEENVQSAIQKLKNIKYDGLLKTNEAIYDLITLGTAMEQTIEGDSKSFNMNYIDWRNPGRNKFHVTVEYSVERSRSTETARPDIVLFVNGIPFCVIECKAPQIEVEQAVSQSIRNQNDDYIPKLFIYSQMVLALNKNSAMYATTGTAAKFWATWTEPGWKEPQMDNGEREFEKLAAVVNQPLAEDVVTKISSTFDVKPEAFTGSRLVTEQDKSLFSLCRPERLLELAWKFTVFDGGIKKVARYQQYFVIKSTLNRVKHFDSTNSRKGGVIWHTQGSGKSLIADNQQLTTQNQPHSGMVLHARSRVPAWLCHFANKPLGIPFITTVHGFNSVSRYSEIMTTGDAVICVSNPIKEFIQKNYDTPDEKITVIHRGIDPTEFDPEKLDQEGFPPERSVN